MVYIVIAIVAVIVIGGIIFFTLSGTPGKSQSTINPGTNNSQPPLEEPSSMDLDDDIKEDYPEDLVTKYTEGTGEGITEVEKLLESDPENVDLLDWLAFMYYSNSEIDKAIDVYKKVLAIHPNNENQHYYLGNSYYKKQMFVEAKQEWEEVIRIKPGAKIAKNAQDRINKIATKL